MLLPSDFDHLVQQIEDLRREVRRLRDFTLRFYQLDAAAKDLDRAYEEWRPVQQDQDRDRREDRARDDLP